MTDWSPLGRCRTMMSEIKTRWGQTNQSMTVSIHCWGNALGMTPDEFEELLGDAELGKAMRGVETILGRRNATPNPTMPTPGTTP